MNDILRKISILLDNATLEKMFSVGMDIGLRSLSSDEFWWYERVCYTYRASLGFFSPHSWKQAHILLERIRLHPEKGMKNLNGRSEDNPLVIGVFIAAGISLPPWFLSECIINDLPLILAHALASDKTEMEADDMNLLGDVIKLDRLEMLRVLISSPRAAVSVPTLESLALYAVTLQRVESLAIILSDERVNPSQDLNRLLCNAIKSGNIPIIELLASNRRVDFNVNLAGILKAVTSRLTPLGRDPSPWVFASKLTNAVQDLRRRNGRELLQLGYLGRHYYVKLERGLR